jgi:hypothetical protein
MNSEAVQMVSRNVDYDSALDFHTRWDSNFAYEATSALILESPEKVTFTMTAAGGPAQLLVSGIQAIDIPAGGTNQYSVDMTVGTHSLEVKSVNPTALKLEMGLEGQAVPMLFGKAACGQGYAQFGKNRCMRCFGHTQAIDELEAGVLHEQIWQATTAGASFTDIFGAVPEDAAAYTAREVNYGTANSMPADVAYKATSTFTLDHDNMVSFSVAAIGEVQLLIDGEDVLLQIGAEQLSGGDRTSTEASLVAGTHTLEVRYHNKGQGSELKLYSRVGCNPGEPLYGFRSCPAGYRDDVSGDTRCEIVPTAFPTSAPTAAPTSAPTAAPTSSPTFDPRKQDCRETSWSVWSTCSKTCGTGGTTTKTRGVEKQPKFGGRDCGTLNRTQPCNEHPCKKAECHAQHVRCNVNYHEFLSDGTVTTCSALESACHMCDTPSQCAAKKMSRTVAVTHDHIGAHLVDASEFKCAVEGGRCACYCSVHPTGAYRKNMIFSASGYIPGNVYAGKTKNECSNLCTHHPSCNGWTWSVPATLEAIHSVPSHTGKCSLADKVTPLVANNDDRVITYAGEKAGVSGATEARKRIWDDNAYYICPVDTYADKDHNGEWTVCSPCPAHTHAKEGAAHLVTRDCMGNVPHHLTKVTPEQYKSLVIMHNSGVGDVTRHVSANLAVEVINAAASYAKK